MSLLTSGQTIKTVTPDFSNFSLSFAVTFLLNSYSYNSNLGRTPEQRYELRFPGVVDA